MVGVGLRGQQPLDEVAALPGAGVRQERAGLGDGRDAAATSSVTGARTRRLVGGRRRRHRLRRPALRQGAVDRPGQRAVVDRHDQAGANAAGPFGRAVGVSAPDDPRGQATAANDARSHS